MMGAAMRVSIAHIRAAGLSADQIVKVLEEAEAERREKERIKKRNQRRVHRTEWTLRTDI